MNSSASRLEALTKDLRVRWQHTRDLWQDEKCSEFDQKYMQELFASVDRAVGVIERLEKVMARIKKDCE
jgi:hypothetical protein